MTSQAETSAVAGTSAARETPSVRDRVLHLVTSGEGGRRISSELASAVGGIELWVWGDLDQRTLEDWRRTPFDPQTASLMLEDLLVYAALARDWHAVAACAAALDVVHRKRGDLLAIALEYTRADAADAADATDWHDRLSPPMTRDEAAAIATCAAAWNARARRLRDLDAWSVR
jgi:hypothetical protein